MRLPAIHGIIDRRILPNFRIDPHCLAAALPNPFRPQLFGDFAIGGICLIRLKRIRPKFLPAPWSIGSENAAHRIVVEWDTNGETKQGVYIPRRDTNSRLNSWAGGPTFLVAMEQYEPPAQRIIDDDLAAKVLPGGGAILP